MATGHLYEIFFDFNDIKYRATRVATSRTNGFVERFNRTVLDEFFRAAFREKLYVSVDELQTDLDAWPHHYNYERPPQGVSKYGQKANRNFRNGKKQNNRVA